MPRVPRAHRPAGERLRDSTLPLGGTVICPAQVAPRARGLPSLVKGARFRVWSRRGSWVQIPLPALHQYAHHHFVFLDAMARKARPTDLFQDIHFVGGYIAHRIAQLQGDGPVGAILHLDRASRDAILEFVRSRQTEVSELRVRTYLAWLPLAAARLHDEFLHPTRETPVHFTEAFPTSSYARGSRVTVAQCLVTFWRWRFGREGQEFPSWLRIKLEKWKPTHGASDMLSRDEVARIAERAQNFRDRAWIWTLFNSGCRPGEIYRLRVGDVVPHDEGYIELRVMREKGSAPEPAPV